jgi:hypothetical protein
MHSDMNANSKRCVTRDLRAAEVMVISPLCLCRR